MMMLMKLLKKFYEFRCLGACFLSVVEVGSLEVVLFIAKGDIFDLGGDFVVVLVESEVKNFGLVMGCVVRLVLCCSNGRGDFSQRFSLMLVEANVFNVGAHLFGIVM